MCYGRATLVSRCLRLRYDTLRLPTVGDGKNEIFEHAENLATAKMKLRKRDGGSRNATIMSTVSLRIVTDENRGLPGRQTVKVGQGHKNTTFSKFSKGEGTFYFSP